MKRLIFWLVSAASTFAFGQSLTPVGAWKTIDDASGQEKALVRITESGGVLTGKVEKLFDPAKQDSKCEECTDSRKGQPVLGMTILRNVKKGEAFWEGGDILDAANGKVYRARLTPSGDNKSMDVRGYMGVPMLGRTQKWVRVE